MFVCLQLSGKNLKNRLRAKSAAEGVNIYVNDRQSIILITNIMCNRWHVAQECRVAPG